MLLEAIYQVSEIISKRKKEYHYHLASKLNNPGRSGETYWSILKTFYNGKKVPLITHFKLKTPFPQILRRNKTFLISFLHLNVFHEIMIVTFPIIKAI